MPKNEGDQRGRKQPKKPPDMAGSSSFFQDDIPSDRGEIVTRGATAAGQVPAYTPGQFVPFFTVIRPR